MAGACLKQFNSSIYVTRKKKINNWDEKSPVFKTFKGAFNLPNVNATGKIPNRMYFSAYKYLYRRCIVCARGKFKIM